MATKYIFCTGGVVSSVGKGVTAAAVGRILRSRGVKVSIQKLDPYLNVDPGTMSPYQHGEVFVLDDGAETDLDLGHYERFIDENLTRASNVTSGQVYAEVIAKERRGDYLGGTIQVIPHVTNEMKRRMGLVARAGCNAPCPAQGIPCEACRGMVDHPNQAALTKVLMEKGGLPKERAETKSRMFTANFRPDAGKF